jgi:hypothetical protein
MKEEKVECEHKNKKAGIVWHSILSGQPNLASSTILRWPEMCFYSFDKPRG